MRKVFLPLIFFAFLVPIAILIWSMDTYQESMVELSDRFFFAIPNGDEQQIISIWSEDGENFYVFLPAYAGLSDTSLLVNTGTKMFLNGQPLRGDYNLGTLELGTAYELTYPYDGTTQTAQLVFLQSANVATMYIRTESGSMDKIHADKNYKENSRIVLVDAEGNIDYIGGGYDKIKGRGNSTWPRDKKPYTLQLRNASAMLGMDAAKKWILLSNAYDVSNIRNKLVYDFAEKTNLYWTPDCEYVDLYLNGEYTGLYLLTEKIEVSKSRLDLSDNSFLFAIEDWKSKKNSNILFSTDSGVKIEITNPSDLARKDIDDFSDDIQSVENLILSGSNDLFESIDLDSWVRKYLIEEVFLNTDAGTASQYFYRDENLSHKIFAGPIWDYDGALYLNPMCFYASTLQKWPTWNTPWYAALYRNEIFYNRIVEIYQNEYLPLLNSLVDHDLNILSRTIEQAAINNNTRWTYPNRKRETYQEDIEYIQTSLKERIDFLNRAWIDGVNYYTIQLKNDGRYLFYNFESGKAADTLPSPKELDVSDSTIWYYDGTDTVFDVTQPITGDLVLYPQSASELEAEAKAKEVRAEDAKKAAEAKARAKEETAKAKAEAERVRAEAEARRPFHVKILAKIKNNIKILVSLGTLFAFMLTLFAADWSRNQRRR